MNFLCFTALGGSSRRNYAALLLAAVIATALAGAIGVHLCLEVDHRFHSLYPQRLQPGSGVGGGSAGRKLMEVGWAAAAQ